MSRSGEEERLSTPSEGNSESKESDWHPQKEENIDSNDEVCDVPKPLGATQRCKLSMNMTKSNFTEMNSAIEENKMPRRAMQISEENTLLKKQLKKQEERIKILATKLIRVISERSNKTKREEILLDEQKARIGDLEHEVSNLREKLQVTKQQLSSYTRLIPHTHPPSRQASMLSSSTATSHSKLNKKPRSARSSGSQQPPRPSTASSSRGNRIDKSFADRVEQLLLEAKAENQALEDQLKHCRHRLITTEEELERTNENLKSKEIGHQEEIITIKSQLDKEQDISKKKKQLSDNIQLIRLQRESRRTASWLSTLEAQCRALEASLASVTETSQQLESQLIEVQEELGQEQQRNITLQKEMEDATSSLNRFKEFEAQITALQDENKIFKDTNESLLKKAFAVTEKVQKAESVEINMKVQMSQLETVLKSEIRSKKDLQESLRQEKEKSEQLEMAKETLQGILEKLNDEMKHLTLASQNPLNEEIATEQSQQTSSTSIQASSKADESAVEMEEELKLVKQQLAAVKDENNKTKSFLRAQLSANQEYQREIEDLTSQLDKANEFHHKKLQDFVKILEERTKQISYLEKCMDEWKFKQTNTTSCKMCVKGKVELVEKDSENNIISKEMSVQIEKESEDLQNKYSNI